MKLPNVSITTVSYNGERTIEKFLKYVFFQDYPRDKLEVIFNDGGSTDKTLDIIKSYIKKYPKNVKLMFNKNKYADGKGFGRDQVTRAAKGDVIVVIDQDNILIEKNWISNVVKVLIENKEINAVQSKMTAPSKANIVDRYLNAIGIEDPFAVAYSLNAQIVFNPEKFLYNEKGDFYTYKVNLDNFLYAGGDGYAIWKKDLMKSGGFIQDTENFYRMALKGYRIAVPKNVFFHHDNSVEFKTFFRKRAYFVMYYLLENIGERNFYWFSLKKNGFWQNLKFINTTFYNLAFFPALIKGSWMALNERKKFWMIHPFMTFIMTAIYVYSFLYVKIFKKVGINYV
jgi:glycosyltransferase involved in cell wall biosynthesis